MKAFNELLLTIDKRDLKTVKRLLKTHPYFFHFDGPQGWPVIHLCINNPVNRSCLDLDLVKLYVAQGGDVNRRTGGGVSLLFLAATHYESKEITDFLESCGAKMSAFEQAVAALFRDENQRRVKATVVRLMDTEPGIIHQTDYDGFTLLHHAVRHYAPQVVRLLLERGADPSAISYDGRTPLGLCGYADDESALSRKLLLSNGARCSQCEELVEWIRDGHDEKAIARFEADPRLRNNWLSYGFGGPLLNLAAWLGRSERVVSYLLDSGVDPNVPNNEGMTALHLVSYRTMEKSSATLEIIRALIHHGADVNWSDDDGRTPLHAAAGNSWEEPVKLLVECGADINSRDNDGWTPLDVVYSTQFLGGRSLAHWMKLRGAVSGKRKPERSKTRRG